MFKQRVGRVGKFLATFKEFPPRMKAGSWDMSKALDSLQAPHTIK